MTETDAATRRTTLAWAVMASGEYEEALRFAMEPPESSESHCAERLRAAYAMAALCEGRGERHLALNMLQHVLRDARVTSTHEARILCDLQMCAGQLLLEVGEPQEAASVLRAAWCTAQSSLGDDSPAAGAAANAFGVACKAVGRYDEAEAAYVAARQILLDRHGPVSDAYATVLHNIAGLAHARGQATAGLPAAKESVRIREHLHGTDHVLVAADVANLGGLFFAADYLHEAEACFTRALEVFRREYGLNHLEVAVNTNNLAALAKARGDGRQAEQLFRQALSIKEACQGAKHPDTLLTRYNLARHLADLGRTDDAGELLPLIIDTLRGIVTPEHTVLRRAQSLANQLLRVQ